MRPLIVFSDVTVDGFMAGPDNDPRLHGRGSRARRRTDGRAHVRRRPPSSSVARRSTTWRPIGPMPTANWPAWMNATPKVVLSSDDSQDVSAWENSTPHRRGRSRPGPPREGVRGRKPGGRSGAVDTVRSLVAADLVDEYWLKVNPAIVGRGRVDVLRCRRTSGADLAQRERLPVRHRRHDLLGHDGSPAVVPGSVSRSPNRRGGGASSSGGRSGRCIATGG